eukprot:1623083-Rhodomonas_salina.3
MACTTAHKTQLSAPGTGETFAHRTDAGNRLSMVYSHRRLARSQHRTPRLAPGNVCRRRCGRRHRCRGDRDRCAVDEKTPCPIGKADGCVVGGAELEPLVARDSHRSGTQHSVAWDHRCIARPRIWRAPHAR